MANSKIDWTKVKKEVETATGFAAEGVLNRLTRSDFKEIGDAVVDEMKKLISKGISPIARAGRFPAYKHAGDKRAATKGLKGKEKKAAALSFNSKYPYSVKKKFPGKKERPVNLFLSGEQMKGLIAKAFKRKVEVGYYDELSAQKESGHREGVNGQPRRPTIPNDSEDFSPSIYKVVNEVLRVILKRKKLIT